MERNVRSWSRQFQMNLIELGRANERLFKRIIPTGNSRPHEESNGRGRGLITGPSQFRTRAIPS
jgi:hypothetical protein